MGDASAVWDLVLRAGLGAIIGYLLLIPVLKEQLRALEQRVGKLEQQTEAAKERQHADRDAVAAECETNREKCQNALWSLLREVQQTVVELKAVLRTKGLLNDKSD